MEIKTILLIILHVQTCTAIFNVSTEDKLSETAATAESNHPLNHNESSTVTGASGRSFAVHRVAKTQTDEPLGMEESLSNCSSKPNDNNKDFVFLSYVIKHTKKNISIPHPCNNTDETEFKILDESAVFLKGPLVTRFMPSFYILIILISLPLNALALVTFTCKIRKKKPPAVYMSHLACVDLLFALLLPLKIHYQFNSSDWVFGEAACRVVTAAYYCYMYCSILLMMSMSVDRLLAVVYPVTSLTWRSTRKASLVCALVWLLALAGTVPLLSLKQSYIIQNVGVTCHDALIYDPTDQLYMIVFSILSSLYYFVPLTVTLVSYFFIIHVLSGKTARLVKSSSSSKKRRKAVIMSVIVLIEFVVCFAPTNGILLYHCVHLFNGKINGEGDLSYSAYILAVCLGSASVFLDPLLYFYGSSQCRQKICSFNRLKRSKFTMSQTNTFPSIEYSKGSVKI